MALNENPDMRTLAFSPTGLYFAFGGNDGRVHIHRTDSPKSVLRDRGSLRHPYHEFQFKVKVAKLSFGEGDATCRRLQRRPPSRRFRDKTSKVVVLAVGLENGSIRIVDVEKRDVFIVLEDHKRSITSLAFSGDGAMILASTSLDGSCKLWDLWDDGNMYHTLRDAQYDNKTSCHSCAWSPDCRTICVTSGTHHATLWNANELEIEGRLVGHKHRITSCDFSPDNTLIATASMDTSMIVWERNSCRPLRQFWHMGYKPSPIYLGGANGHYVLKVCFSRDSVHLVTVCEDKFVRFWDMDYGSTVTPEIEFSTSIFGADDGCFTDALLSPSGTLLAMSCVDQRESFFCVARTPVRQSLLMHLCRSSIRQRMTSEQIYELPLPKIMKKFLCFQHNEIV